MIDDNEFQCLAYFNINYVISTYCIVLIGLNSANKRILPKFALLFRLLETIWRQSLFIQKCKIT